VASREFWVVFPILDVLGVFGDGISLVSVKHCLAIAASPIVVRP
jgi:hypothetical protein